MQITRWIVLQKARRHRTSRLRLLVRTQFQDLFHSPSGVLLTFPSRYLFSIDRKIYLALGGGPPRFSQGFTCPDLLDKTNIRLATLCIPGYHCLWPVFPNCSARLAKFVTLCKIVVALASNREFWDCPLSAKQVCRGPVLRTGCL